MSKVGTRFCEKCGRDVSLYAWIRHIRSNCKPKEIIGPKDEHGKTQKWYDSMEKRRGTDTGNNKGRIASKETRKKISIASKNRKHSEETKRIIGEKRKQYLKEHENDFGAFTKRWKREPSYPEKWFSKVIENEGFDRNYISEMRFGKYVLDFAWIEKKKCIEIDGSQHEWPSRKESDKRKDEFIKNHGWLILRIKWKDCFDDPKYWIRKSREFLSS